MTEAAIERALLRRARQAGVWAPKMEMVHPGFPDRGLFMPGGRLRLVELKTPSGRIRTDQRATIALLERLGFDVRVIRHVAEFDDLFSELEGE